MSSEAPQDWKSITLSAACAFFTDGDWVESKDQDPDGEVRLIQLADIGDGAFLDKSDRFLTAEKAGDLRCSLLEPGDLLIARMADPIARCCLFPGLDQPAATVVDVAIARAREGVDQSFLSYAISNRAFRQLALGAASGTTRSRISRSNLGALPILLPPLDEQRRIAEVLRSVDETIRLANETAHCARATFNRLIDDLHRQHEHDVAPLSSFCVPKGLQTGPFGSQLKVADYTDGGVPVIMPSDLTPEGIDFLGAKSTSSEKAAQLPQHRLRAGDILFSRRGEVDKCGLYLQSDPPALCGTGCLRARIDASKADPVLIYFLVQSDRCGSWLKQHAVGVTMPNLNTTIVGSLPVPNLPLPVQKRWVEALLLAEAACRANESYVAEAHKIKLALSSDLISGRVRVAA